MIRIRSAALCLLLAMGAAAPAHADQQANIERDARLIGDALDAMPAQQPGVVDLYAVSFAGDGTEDVFRNEATYFEALMRQRFHARGTLALVNHPDSIGDVPRPLATYRNLRLALDGLATRMDRDEDLLVLYLTMHGSPDHALVMNFPPLVEDQLLPEDLALLLQDSGIRHRVVAISACFSGGFVPALGNDDTLVLTAARADRPSFGCGTESTVTYFGHAWMVEGLNRFAGFVDAFEDARARIRGWERSERLRQSHPQAAIGAGIPATLERWQAQAPPGAELPYPYPLER